MRMILLLSALVLSSTAALAEDGQAIFARTCATCHFTQRDPARRDEMVAPPMDMLSARLRQLTSGDRDAFVRRLVGYVRKPDPAQSIDPMAVQRFGLMPAIGDSFPDLTDAQLSMVAEWVFDNYAGVKLPPGAGMGGGMGGAGMGGGGSRGRQ